MARTIRPRAVDRRSVLGGMMLVAPGLAKAATGPLSPVVDTAQGRLKGAVDNGVAVFRGVAYGAPTGGRNRFQAPQPPERWAGLRLATAFGDSCPQPALPQPPIYSSWAVDVRQSEDCLRLNIWTPEPNRRRKRPVMVWIHGGGFAVGTASLRAYDGARLARRGDVVVCSVNHRLNIFGYLPPLDTMPASFAGSANCGQLDLVAALGWIQDNIEAFGGDPGNVTLFGQSGGGAKICVLLAMPAARDLFHKSIVQSGPLLRGVERSAADRLASDVLRVLDIGPRDADRLQAASVGQLLAAYGALAAEGRGLSFAPAVDGAVLPSHPFQLGGPGVVDPRPLLIGSNRDEGTAFAPPEDFALEWADVPGRLTQRIGLAGAASVVARLRDLHPEYTPRDAFFAVTSQFFMRANTLRLAELRASGRTGATYLYDFDWRSPVDGGRWGATHGVEIPFVFDTLDVSEPMVGKGAGLSSIAAPIQACWIAFARHGRPSNALVPDWPAYDLARRSIQAFNGRAVRQDDPSPGERALFADLPALNMAG